MAYRIKLRRSKRIAYFIGGLAVLVLSFLSTLFLLDHGLLSPSHSVLIAERRFDYRDGAVGKLWLGTGWSVPDSLGVWTDGERAEMEIKLGERTRRVELLIKT